MDDDQFNQFEEAQQNLSQRETQPSEYSQSHNISFPQLLMPQQQSIVSGNQNPSDSSISLYNNLEQFQFENGSVKQQFHAQLTKTHSVYDVFENQISMDIQRNNSLKQTPLSFIPQNSHNRIGKQTPIYQSNTNNKKHSSINSHINQLDFNYPQHQDSNYSMMTNLSSSNFSKESDNYFFQNMSQSTQPKQIFDSAKMALNIVYQPITDRVQIADMGKRQQQISYESFNKNNEQNQNKIKNEENNDFKYFSSVKHTVSIVNIGKVEQTLETYNQQQQNQIKNQNQKKQTIILPKDQDQQFEFTTIKPQTEDQLNSQPVPQIHNIQTYPNSSFQYTEFNVDLVKEEVSNCIVQNHEIPSIQKTVVQIRKQSDQFVFQQQICENISPVVNHTVQHIDIIQDKSLHTHNDVQNTINNGEINYNKEEETINKNQEEDDQFGDFQQSQPTNIAISQPQVGSNIIEIKEQYINSHQSQYYASKKVQLQKFVDTLPDYSFILAQSFCI